MMDYPDLSTTAVEDFGIAAEPAEALRINRELTLARRIVEQTGAHLFLTGKAGTGKTTFLRRLRETSAKRMIVLAPSGVAAINAQGQTIHSFFQFPLSLYIPGQGFTDEKHYARYSRQTRRIISTLDLLVIDEISMVRPDLLDAIDATLRRMRHSESPFGGVQLLLIGDLRQLSPVVKDADWEIMRQYYGSPYFFESRALRQSGFMTVELTTVYRQTDRRFIDILNAVREGRADRAVLDEINARHRPGFNPAVEEGYIRLTTHNRRAADINASRLAALPSAPVTFTAVVKGKFPESAYPADKELTLKLGAQVMFLKNDSALTHRYFNGMLGTVTGLTEDRVTVTPADGSEPVDVDTARWENARYTVDDETKAIRQETEGSFEQLPLRLAWAITIHKSQGLTFDRAIIDAAASFAPGQAYVALSRCRSLDGMVLESRLSSEAVITDATVNSFISDARRKAPDEQTLLSLSEEYFRSILSRVFDFRPISMLFNDLARAIEEYIVPLHRHIGPQYAEMSRRLETRVAAVGERFARIYASPGSDIDSRELKEKIRSGCRYFIDELTPVLRLMADTPRDIDNAAYAERLNNASAALLYPLSLSLRILTELSRTDFTTAAYVNIKARAILDLDSENSPVAPRKTKAKKKAADKPKAEKPKAEKKPKGYSQYLSLSLFRQGKTIDEIAAERSLATSTIVGHLASACLSGELDRSTLIDPTVERRLGEIYHGMGRPAAGDFTRAAFSAGFNEQAIMIYLKLKRN